MTSSTRPGRRRCRSLRVERDDVLWLVTCRTIEERFWLHPLIACGVERFGARADKRIARMVRGATTPSRCSTTTRRPVASPTP